MNDAVLEYLTEQQCARQWKGFLRAMGDEFAAQWSCEEMQSVMRRLGSRFAQQNELGASRTLADLQLAMGRVWVDIDWGWVALEQQPDHLRILHYCAPLQAAFGADAAAWSPAFLEGVYQQWFAHAQAGTALRVSQVPAGGPAGVTEFRLGVAVP